MFAITSTRPPVIAGVKRMNGRPHRKKASRFRTAKITAAKKRAEKFFRPSPMP